MATRIGILTVSDTRTRSTDESGPAVKGALETLGYQDFETDICADDLRTIQRCIRVMANHCQVVFTTGGTGFSHRDVTPEATSELIQRRADNLSELIRLKGLEKTPFSHLSRGVAGLVGTCLVVNLPGSPAGAREGVEAIGHLLEPILAALSGDACPAAPQ